MSKNKSKSSDEILNELFGSLNLPISPKSSGKNSKVESNNEVSRSNVKDKKNGYDESDDSDLSSNCSTDQEIDKLLEESVDVTEQNNKIEDNSVDSKLKKSKKRKKSKDSNNKKKKKKRSHKYNSSDSDDSSHKRRKSSRSYSHSAENETSRVKKEDKKQLESLSRSKSKTPSRTSKKRSRSHRSSSISRHHYSHSRSPSISKKHASHCSKKRRSSSSLSLSPPPKKLHRRTKSKSRSPVLKDKTDPLDAWRTAKLASLKKNATIKSDSATVKTDSTLPEKEKKTQVVVETIPLPIPISTSDFTENSHTPDIIPLSSKDFDNAIITPDLDLKSIPVPSVGESSNSAEGMNSENSSLKITDSENKNQDKTKDDGKNKMIVIKSLKDSLVLQQAEEAQKKVKTDVEDNHNMLDNGDNKDTGGTNSTLPINEGSENKDAEGLHTNAEAKEISLIDSMKSKNSKDISLEKEIKQESVEKAENKKSSDKLHKKSKKDKDSHSERKSKHRGRSRSKSRHRSRSRSKRRSRSRSKRKSRSRSKRRSRSRSKRRSRSRSRKSSKSKRRSRSRSRKRKRSRSGGRSKSKRSSRSRSRGRKRSKDRRRSHSRSRSRSRSKISSKSVKMPPTFNRQESPDCVDSLRDKATRKRLLEVARKNAFSYMKNSSVPQAIENETFSTAGKSIDELTNFCQQLVAKDYSDTELSDPSLSPDETHDPEYGKAFVSGRHPFAVKDSKPILMNIRNAPMLPVKTNAERLADTSKLREQFPVSSGSQHRTVAEIGWVPVAKDEAKAKEEQATVFPEQTSTAKDISQLVSTRLSAMRKLQDNPTDREAMTALNSAQKEMQNWALSKQKPGQFTGSTGARILSQEELSSGFQVWARKDQFKEANPVSSHFGLKMLQKMGWNPGEGLGKNKEGTVEPLVLDFKMDKKGLIAAEEMTSRKIPIPLAKNLAGKHPVSALVEICSKRKWNPPEFEVVFDAGPDHKKNFLLKVHVNNQTYKPAIAASTKKIAKANAAAACLQALGLIPKTPAPVAQATLNTTAKPAGTLCTTTQPTGQPQTVNPASIPPPPGPPQGAPTTAMSQPPAPPQNGNQNSQGPMPPPSIPPVPGEASKPPLPAERYPTSQNTPNHPVGPGTSNSRNSGKQPVSYPTPMGGMYGGNQFGPNAHYNQMHYFGGRFQRPPY